MSETTQPNIRPRVREAVKVWDNLPAQDKNYRRVAEIMDITVGRAAVYVREGLVAMGRGDETPRGNNITGSSGSKPTREVSDFEAQIEAMVEQNKATVDDLTSQIAEAQKESAEFDGEKYIAAEEERLQRALTEAGERLEAWLNDTDKVASSAAEAQEKRLKERAETLVESNGEQIEKARDAAEKAEAMLAAIREQETPAPETPEPSPAE